MLRKGYEGEDKAPDWKLFAAKCRQATVQANGREPETMWELMLDGKMQKTARAEARRPDMEQLAFDWTGGGAAIKLLPLSAAGKEAE